MSRMELQIAEGKKGPAFFVAAAAQVAESIARHLEDGNHEAVIQTAITGGLSLALVAGVPSPNLATSSESTAALIDAMRPLLAKRHDEKFIDDETFKQYDAGLSQLADAMRFAATGMRKAAKANEN